VKKLYVHYEGQIVGQLTQDDDLIYSYQYNDNWLNNKNSFPISLSLPLQKEAFGNRLSLSFFENLLPEGDVKKEIEEAQALKGVFSFLEQFGKDCAGAITVSRSFEIPPNTGKNKIEIDLQKIYSAMEEKRAIANVIAEENPGYLSLAGAQDKFPGIYHNSRLYLPIEGQPTTHIIKAPIWRHNIKESVYNELYIMQLAKSVGFQIPNCFILKGPHPLFIIERYDRYFKKNKDVRRIHQQDFCQAQGIVSDKKYEKEGGPSIRANYDLILKHVSPKKRLESVETFLKWICFNLIVGNNDCHSKNISFLYNEGKVELTPFYDLLSTTVYPKLIRAFAYKIGQTTEYHKMSTKEFHLTERLIGVKEGKLITIFNLVLQKILKERKAITQKLMVEYPEVKIFSTINEDIDLRVKTFKNQNIINE
jgi:serine/threonine-protein kinase HipA